MIDVQSVELSPIGTELTAFDEGRIETPKDTHGRELLRSQRMNTVMLQTSQRSYSRLLRNRIYCAMLAFGLLVLPCRAFAQQKSQPPSDNSDASSSTVSRSSVAGQDSQNQDLQGSQNDSEMENRQGQGEVQEQGLEQGSETSSEQEADTPVMSAEQIISILRQQPDALASIKEQVAQQTGIDPKNITDASLYTRIRQSESVRILATKELTARGFSVDSSETIETTPAATRNSQRTKVPRSVRTQVPPYKSPDEPQVQRRVSPYVNLPSMSDLYTQFPSRQQKLQRFGSDAFLIGSGNANELPLDLPVGSDYVLGSGDNLVLNLSGSRTGRIIRSVDRQGQVELPEAGVIMIGGMTIAQAQTAMDKVLATQFQNEHVEISLGRVRTVRVYVVGDVQRPGAYDVSALSTPLSTLYEAGGPTSRGSLRILRQYRGRQLVKDIDLYDFLLHGMRSEDERLLPGDTILVPPAGPQVTVEGMVHRPAIYELNGEQSLDEVLQLAGGVLVSADLKQINVARIEAHERRTMFSLQLNDNQTELHNELAAFKVKDGDDVVISQITPYNEQAVYLEGHVYHPGKFPYREGMTVADLLHSYQDVLPEPSDRAELVHLQPPDFRPVATEFNLRDALVGNESVPLRPLDVIHIYGRYEVDSPKVSIQGEVIRPGSYPMSQGMTAAGLVRLAGGFRRSAFRNEADVASYTVQNGQRVVIDHSQIALEKAMEGDKSADVVLKPGDVVSIRRLTGWQDIGSSITINGEVMHPGSYGIAQGDRLSEVIKRAGGFTINAYPYAAVLERVRVRELGEQARLQMIQRIEDTPVQVKQGTLSTSTVTSMQSTMQAQREEILRTLRTRTASGRLVIRISSDISAWENTAADVEVRAGDILTIPKRPDFVAVNGQVYNPVAISYAPGKKLGWYLKRAGGTTSSANRKGIYVLRADGTVVPHPSRWLGGGLMGLRMRPGDTIFIPEKIEGGSVLWQNILGTAQIMSATMLPLAVAGVI